MLQEEEVSIQSYLHYLFENKWHTVGFIFLWVSFLRENEVALENGEVENQQSQGTTETM